MATWKKALDEFRRQKFNGWHWHEDAARWIESRMSAAVRQIASTVRGRTVIFYGSGHLEGDRYGVRPGTTIDDRDLHALHCVSRHAKKDKGLCLVLYAGDGDPRAARSIAEYLRGLGEVDVVVPLTLGREGTLLALSAKRIFMGRQSYLFPFTKNRLGHFSDWASGWKAKTGVDEDERVDRESARKSGLAVEDLEAHPELDDAVFTAFNFMQIGFAETPLTKIVASSHGAVYVQRGPRESAWTRATPYHYTHPALPAGHTRATPHHYTLPLPADPGSPLLTDPGPPSYS